MNERVKALYQKVILAHNNAPFHFEKREHAEHTIKAYNAVCGDKFQIYLDIEEGKINDIHFHGYGCAISKAATSVLVQSLLDKTLAEAQMILLEYQNYLEGKLEGNELFEAFSAAKDFPGRAQCASMSWEALNQFLVKEL